MWGRALWRGACQLPDLGRWAPHNAQLLDRTCEPCLAQGFLASQAFLTLWKQRGASLLSHAAGGHKGQPEVEAQERKASSGYPERSLPARSALQCSLSELRRAALRGTELDCAVASHPGPRCPTWPLLALPLPTLVLPGVFSHLLQCLIARGSRAQSVLYRQTSPGSPS